MSATNHPSRRQLATRARRLAATLNLVSALAWEGHAAICRNYDERPAVCCMRGETALREIVREVERELTRCRRERDRDRLE